METNGERGPNRLSRRSLVLLLLILLVAMTARYYHLGQIPGGLFMDEAADGNDAARSLQNHLYQVFYKGDAGREGMWIVMMSASIAHYGHTVYAVRFWAPLTGLLTVLALYGLAARWFGSRVALIAAWLLATSFWHLVFSRIAFRGILVPLFLVTSIYFLQVAWESRGGKAAIFALLGGFCFGLGFYSYIAFRIAPVLLAIIIVLEFARSARDRRPHFLRVTGTWVVVAIATVIPLIIYFTHNPGDFFTRASQVSIWRAAHPVLLLLRNIVRTAWMFIGKGDQNWRHNLRPYPELLYPVGIFVLIGIAMALIGRAGDANDERRSRAIYLLIWLGVMAIPAILTREGVPHALRSIGTLPAAILLAALGADWLLTRWRTRRVLLGAVVAILLASGGVDLYRYFFVWARKPQVQQAFQLPLLKAAEALRDTPSNVPVLVLVDEPTDYDWEAVAFDYHEEDRTVRLPLQANIPLFIAAGRPSTMYLPSSANLDFKKWYGCESPPPLSSVLENRLTYVPGCGDRLMVLHLSK